MKENIIEISRISSVSAYSGILLHAVGAVYVKIDTQSGKRKRADFEIVLLRRDCKYLVSSICESREKEQKFLFGPEKICMMALSATSAITGAVLMFSVINYMSQLTEENIAKRIYEGISGTAAVLDFLLPRAIGIMAAVAAAGFVFSFAYTLFKYSNFSVSRSGGSDAFVYISRGLVSKTEIWLKSECVAAAFVISRPLMRLLHNNLTLCYAAGYGKSNEGISVLLPAAGAEKTEECLYRLLPEIRYSAPVLRPRQGSEHKFIIPQLICLALLPAAAGILALFAARHTEDLFFIALVAIVIIVIWLLTGWYYSRRSGLYFGENDNSLCFVTYRYSCGVSARVNRRSVSFVKVTQSPFETKSGLCSLKIYVYSGGKTNFKIKGLEYEEVIRMLVA